jgi:mRNA-degrading endonuclease toxin of MazEF toxin-antitoxin module
MSRPVATISENPTSGRTMTRWYNTYVPVLHTVPVPFSLSLTITGTGTSITCSRKTKKLNTMGKNELEKNKGSVSKAQLIFFICLGIMVLR